MRCVPMLPVLLRLTRLRLGSVVHATAGMMFLSSVLVSPDGNAVLYVPDCALEPEVCQAVDTAVPVDLDSLDNGGLTKDYPDIVMVPGLSFSGVFAPDQSVEKYTGVLPYEGFDPSPPTPGAPLKLFGQGDDRNIMIVDGDALTTALQGRNVAAGLLDGSGTPGSLAMLYDIDQTVVGIDIVTFDGWVANPNSSARSFLDVYAFARDGTLIGSGPLALQDYLLSDYRLLQSIILASGDAPFAGLLFVTDDNFGVGFTGLRYDTPTPSALLLMIWGFLLLRRTRR